MPDPNTFGGPVYVRRKGASQWSEVPLTHGFSENSRGIGLADMAYALISGRPHRANGDMAYHVLDIMNGFLRHLNPVNIIMLPAPVNVHHHFRWDFRPMHLMNKNF